MSKRKVGSTKKAAKPKTEPVKGAKKPKKKEHPLIGTKNPELYPFTETPEDFDPKKHKPLRNKDFKGKAQHLIHRAEIKEADAAALREEAVEVAKSGDKGQRKRVNKLKKLREQQKELTTLLTEQGVDVDAILEDEDDDNE